MKKNVCLILMLAIFSLAGFSQVTLTQSTGLMDQPSLTSKRITVAIEGDQVDLIEKSGEFWKVTYKRETGYIHESCLSNYIATKLKEEENPVKVIEEAQPVVQDSAEIVIDSKGKLMYKGAYLTSPQLKKIISTNPAAKSALQSGTFLYYLGLVSAGVSGGILGTELGSGKVTSTGLVLTGVFLGAGIGAVLLSSKQFKKAVQIYNQDIRLHNGGKVALRIGMADHGYGITLSF
jgi:hypothetical protein